MDRKIAKIYIITAVLGIVCTVFSALALQTYTYNRTTFSNTKKSAECWTDKMQKKELNGTYLFSTVLPKDGIDGMVIACDTTHMFLEVTIDGEIVYNLKTEKIGWMKTTGYQWNFISLMKRDAGKEILFRVRPAYSDTKPKGGFYYGTLSEVEHIIVKERLPKFFITCMILIAGIFLLLYTIIILEKGGHDDGLRNFTVFAIMLGIWMMCESQILELYLPCGIAMVFLDHLMLMLMPLQFLLFLRNIYPNKDHPLWHICCVLNCTVVAVRIFLQMTGLSDLRETLWLTHIMLCIFVVCIFILSILVIIKKELNKQLKPEFPVRLYLGIRKLLRNPIVIGF